MLINLFTVTFGNYNRWQLVSIRCRVSNKKHLKSIYTFKIKESNPLGSVYGFAYCKKNCFLQLSLLTSHRSRVLFALKVLWMNHSCIGVVPGCCASSPAHAVKEKRPFLVSMLTISNQDRELYKRWSCLLVNKRCNIDYNAPGTTPTWVV